MAIENDFLVWAGASGANVLSQAAYAALNQLPGGDVTGVASSQQANKTWRQASIIAAMIAQAIVDGVGQPAIDDGTTSTLEQNFFQLFRTQGYATDTGPANAMAISLAPAPTTLAQLVGSILRIKVGNTNTGASTLNVNGLGAVSILNPDGTALIAGQLFKSALEVISYDGTNFRLVGGGAAIEGTTGKFSGGLTLGGTLTGTTINGTGLGITGGATVTGTMSAGAVNAGSLFASGDATIDGALGALGAGTFGSLGVTGSGSINGNLAVAGQILASLLVSSGNASITGTVSAANSRLTSGARGTGDGERVPNLNDWQFSFASTNSGYLILPNNVKLIVTGGSAGVNPNPGLLSTTFGLPIAFTSTFAAAVCSYLGNTPPPGIGLSVEPANLSQCIVTTNTPLSGLPGPLGVVVFCLGI